MSAALLLVAVVGCMVGAAAMNRKGWAEEMEIIEVKEAFSEIRIEDAECSVRVLRATDGKCKVVCPEKQDGSIYHTVTVSDGALSVQRHVRKWYQYIGISFGSPDVKIYLPEEAYGRLAIHTISGSIQVDDGFTFETASLESTSGSVRMRSEVKRELEAESTSGRVTIENASPERIEASSVSGRIALSHLRSDEIAVRSTSGGIELTDVIAATNLDVRSVSGGVALDGCDGGAIRIETTSGSVKGTVLTEKDFIANSTSGSVSIPHSSAGGACEISTTSGRIAIEVQR